MLIGRYATRTREIDIEGDIHGLLALTKALSDSRHIHEIILSPSDPAPYDGLLRLIRIKKEADEDMPVHVTRDADELTISGPAKKLEILAHNIKFLTAQGVDPRSTIQDHIHEEFYEDHPYLSAKSEPLTISFTHANGG